MDVSLLKFENFWCVNSCFGGLLFHLCTLRRLPLPPEQNASPLLQLLFFSLSLWLKLGGGGKGIRYYNTEFWLTWTYYACWKYRALRLRLRNAYVKPRGSRNKSASRSQNQTPAAVPFQFVFIRSCHSFCLLFKSIF